MARLRMILGCLLVVGLSATTHAEVATTNPVDQAGLVPMWIGAGVPLEKWIWHPTVTDENATLFFRRELQVDESTSHVILELSVDNAYTLYVNGQEIGTGGNFNHIERYGLEKQKHLSTGRNLIAVEAFNTGGPGGMLCGIEVYDHSGRAKRLPATDWLCSDRPAGGWSSPDFQAVDWVRPIVVADLGGAPWPNVGKQGAEDEPDSYVAFRGRFELAEAGQVEIRTLGASWFVVWLDGELLTEGPARFHKDHPGYDTVHANLSAGEHVLAAQVHHLGLTTRMLDDMPPFFACEVLQDDKPLAVQWRCTRLAGYQARVRRINPQLGWIEWCDTRRLPVDWQSPDFDDTIWRPTAPRNPGIGEPEPLRIATVQRFVHRIEPMAEGRLAETFGGEHDDEPARFFLRDLACDKLPAQGVWRRYDLGRVRLARPRLVLDLPSGTIVEFAYSEALTRGRVSPYITLSTGSSCNLDHYVARGGPQEFFPLAPRGGRFVEVHVLANPDEVRFIREEFVERCYHGAPQGSFRCDDALLERIWMTGIETYRACSEDALIDNPTRERGQWTGDVVTVGMDIAAVGYSDVRLARRGLVQSALCARSDGLIAGLCPGGEAYLTTYAAQWIPACLHYWELTGDRSLLEEVFPYAERNIAAFEPLVTDEGLIDGLGWGFVDWGYVRNPGAADMAVTMHLLDAVRGMIRWCRLLGHDERIPHYQALERRLAQAVGRWIAAQLEAGESAWEQIGYHRAVLSLRMGLFKGQAERDCIEYIKNHILRCFPNNPTAPRNSDPTLKQSQLITPYFAHYAFPPLIERGQMDFVLDQYRRCWGWALEDGRTTWLEVFDTRWTHCHQWAGCPTWQLSRYLLGLHARFDLGKNHFEFRLAPGSLQRASGSIPLPDGSGTVDVRWERSGEDRLNYQLASPAPIWLHVRSGTTTKIIKIDDRHAMTVARERNVWQPKP